jgi:hypothetical protein
MQYRFSFRVAQFDAVISAAKPSCDPPEGRKLLESELLKKKITCIRVLLMNEEAYYLQVYIDKYHIKKERLNRGSYMVASLVTNLIYKPLVLEPGVLILVGSF